MRIERFLEDSVISRPSKTALVVGERRLSYAELDELANRAAHVLLAAGLARGDRVVMVLDNSVEAVALLFGASKAGAVFSLVNPATRAGKLAFIVNDLEARFVVTQRAHVPVVAEAIAQASSIERAFVVGASAPALDSRFALWDEALETAPHTPPTIHRGIDLDLAYVIYTSGSTGFPKGVMMTHQSADAGASAIIEYLENTSDDVILSVVPLSFDYGMYQVLMTFKFGGTIVLEKSFAFPQVVLKRLAQEQATGLPLVPTTASLLLSIKGLEPGRFPHLRYITNTAAALPPAHSRRLQELFPTASVFSMYGLTENIRGTYLPPEQLATRPTSVGKAIPNSEATIVDEQGRPVGPGVVGELTIRGPNLLKGYWRNPEATDAALRPGPYPWEKVFYTGDLFRADDEGYLYYIGRKDDMLKTRGEKVSPKEVENVLYALEGVREAAVVGLPDPVLGMAIKAIIATADKVELTERDVQRHCARYLEDFMVPGIVEFRTELPKTESGKIRRRALQDEASARTGGTDRPSNERKGA